MKTIEELAAIVEAGGGFEIDAKNYAPEGIKSFIGKTSSGAIVRIINASAWSQDELVSVAQHGTPGVVSYAF